MEKIIEIPEGYEARIKGNKVVIEPKESEDERIRKEIIEYLTIVRKRDLVARPERQRWITYLEKQKEQKPAQYDIDILEKHITKDSISELAHTVIIRNGWEIVEKEQKPAECLKAERDGWYVCIKDYYRGGRKRSSVGDLVQAKGGMHIMGEEDISEWFRKAYYEEVRDTFEHPEKPAGGSEEDEKMLGGIIERGNSEIPRGECGLTPNQVAWLETRLKSVRPQPKQESEPIEIKYAGKIYEVYGTKELPGGVVGYIIEDEPGHYDCIIHPDKVLGGGYGIKSSGSPYPTKEANFGQPHWKPSEEQMEALLLAIEGKWDAIKPTGYMSRRLEDLYEGLVNTFNIDENYLKETDVNEKGGE